MTTLVSDPVRYIADQWENNCGYASAVLSGIVPDAAHLSNGGYHCSVNDLYANGNGNDYSNVRPDDHDFNKAYGAAIDMSMNTSDMVKCYTRIHAVWADTSDSRRKYLNCINSWDGSGDAARLDFYKNTIGYADDSHKWHNHQETRRRYLLDMTAAQAIVSVLRGETKEQWEASMITLETMSPYGRTYAQHILDLWYGEVKGNPVFVEQQMIAGLKDMLSSIQTTLAQTLEAAKDDGNTSVNLDDAAQTKLQEVVDKTAALNEAISTIPQQTADLVHADLAD